jgi:polysaccharide export outer membrane protein
MSRTFASLAGAVATMHVFKQYALVLALIGLSGAFASGVYGQSADPPSQPGLSSKPDLPPQPEPSSKNPNYLVGPQDVLTVSVFDEAQLSGRFRVDNDGQLNYPFVGRLQAGGATVAEIAARIRTKLADGYLRDPQVTVEVEVYRSQNVFVMGEVRSPGKYTVTGAVTIVEVLAQAGSTTPTAGNQVLVLHPKKATDGGAGSSEQASTDVQRVNLGDIQAGDLSANITVHDGDTIFVPKAQRFYVTGYVHSPGAFVLEPDLTVLQAISMAGGVTDLGSSRGLRVVRNKKEMDAKPTDIVQADDMIIVRRRRM